MEKTLSERIYSILFMQLMLNCKKSKNALCDIVGAPILLVHSHWFCSCLFTTCSVPLRHSNTSTSQTGQVRGEPAICSQIHCFIPPGQEVTVVPHFIIYFIAYWY